MLLTLALPLGLALLFVGSAAVSLARNVVRARRSGLVYSLMLVNPFSRVWLLACPLLLPLLARWQPDGLLAAALLHPDWPWQLSYALFQRCGADTVLLVHPWGFILAVADPLVVGQISARRADFPKPIAIYRSLDIYGKNVVSTEGPAWRRHRRAVAPAFTERNHQLVWEESLRQASALLACWSARAGLVSDLAGDTMRLTLHVISAAAFGVKLAWPHQRPDSALPAGHRLSFTDAIHNLLDNVLPLLILPAWLLKKSPFRGQRNAYEAFVEWGKYMRELVAAKTAGPSRPDHKNARDLLGSLVSSVAAEPSADEQATAATLSPDELIGNVFILALAGHETTANTLHFCLIYLALNWQSQERLQQDLDAILADRPVEDWSYEEDSGRLYNSMVGASMNELLRLIPPVVAIPKSTLPHAPQALTIAGGGAVVVPAGTFISLGVSALHRHSRHWPGGDLDHFRPERWLSDPASESGARQTLFQPQKGLYIPFSEGPRACLGKRFAQLEILAVLAVVLRHHSVELVPNPAPADAPSVESLAEAWTAEANRTRNLMQHGLSTVFTLQMRNDSVPLRLVKRGAEQFRLRPL